MRSAAWSIFGRLMFMLGAATLLSYLASGLWLYCTAVAEADQMFDAALDHTAHAVLAVVRDEASELNETKAFAYELTLIGKTDEHAVVYQVRGPNGILVFRSHGAPVAPLAEAHSQGFTETIINGVEYRVFTLATELDAATIHVAEPIARRSAVTRAGVARLLAPGAAQMLALVATVAWTVRRTTRPLVHYAKSLNRLNIDTDTSIDGSKLPLELQSVARAVNGLLVRVHDSLLRERTLTADAAHEIRNPLAALRLQAQIARRAKDPTELHTALDELLAASDRAARMADSVLTLARLDADGCSPMGKAQVEVGKLAALIEPEFTTLAARRDIHLLLSADNSRMRGDEDALAIALRNLLDNALRFARTRIEIHVAGQGEHVAVTIRDDGPGFSDASATRAFHRFFRGFEQGRGSDGAGLGLALVLRIVQLHVGTIRIVPGIDGGAGIEMQFPRDSTGSFT